jgi:MFS family permease
LPWIAIAGIGAGTVLSYAILAELFPKSASGRANAALNLLSNGSAVAVQVAVGFIVELWPIDAGRHPPMAYQTALGIILALQVMAFLWFVRPKRHSVPARHLSAHPIHTLATTLGIQAAVAVPYLKAREDWRLRQAIAQGQVSSWRAVALVSIVTAAAISSALLMPASTTTVTAHAGRTSPRHASTAAAPILSGLTTADASAQR